MDDINTAVDEYMNTEQGGVAVAQKYNISHSCLIYHYNKRKGKKKKGRPSAIKKPKQVSYKNESPSPTPKPKKYIRAPESDTENRRSYSAVVPMQEKRSYTGRSLDLKFKKHKGRSVLDLTAFKHEPLF